MDKKVFDVILNILASGIQTSIQQTDIKRLLKKRSVLLTFFSTTTYTTLPYFGTYFLRAV
jgi:hypothetical protein